MIRVTMLAFCGAALLVAQTASPNTAATNAAVSGTVKDRTTGRGLPNFNVSTRVNGKDVQSTSDSAGHYRLGDLPSGSYSISVVGDQRPRIQMTRRVLVNGSDLQNIDFPVRLAGIISGKIVDENKEPVPDVWVRAVTREYYLGNLGYHYTDGMTRTNDRGEFTMSVQSGRPFLLMAEKYQSNLPAYSEVPLDPKLRRRVPMRTWYPNSPLAEGGQPITVSAEEKRMGVDIQMRKGDSHCVEGTATGATEATLRFTIEPTDPSSGLAENRGTFVSAPGGKTAADGKFRICDLYSGGYRLSVDDNRDSQVAPNFGVAEIHIGDEDLRGLKLAALPGKMVEGEAVWDAGPPAAPPAAKLSVSLAPLFRARFQGEDSSARLDVPGTFAINSVFGEDYSLQTQFSAPGMYVKDVTFGNRSVLFEPMRPASAISGSALRVVLAHDGGTVSVQVADKDGNPGSNVRVVLIPADTRSEGEMAARMVQGQTNQLGQYTSPTVHPGKYYVAVTPEAVEPTPESLGKVWQARNRYPDVDVAPGGSPSVRVEIE